MKNALIIICSFLLINFFSCSGNQQSAENATENVAEQNEHDHSAHTSPTDEKAKKPLSPRTSAMANIGDAHVHIDYSSPGVRGRTIWGGLVAYDQVWVTGAHKATSINFNKDVKIKGQTIAAGTYGFFTIPGREEWVIILNKNYEQHLADDYDEALDVLRLTVTPEQLKESVESLTYEVSPTAENKGTIAVSWDQIKVGFEFEVL